MTKIGRDQVMMASEWIGRGVSQRTVARQLGVSEATLRYRRHRAAMDVGDGRRIGGPSWMGSSPPWRVHSRSWWIDGIRSGPWLLV